ncbi:MAG TPA: FkbM family methyltransferase [Acetobacteraceae bacterium]|jgi:FkbM family methyltransferase|nr:FkbM family methyltransferase [Acetobacteraceae bacterium]
MRLVDQAMTVLRRTISKRTEAGEPAARLSSCEESPDPEAQHARLTYSIEAEDLLVDRIYYDLLGIPRGYRGFYVDVGAFDPVRASNTFRLYQSGWRGINIEANPAAIERFVALRPRDINLNVAVGPEGTKDGIYVTFDEPLLNGFLAADIIDHHRRSGRVVLSQQIVPFRTLNSLLAEHAPASSGIDFLNIDVELMEHAILSEFALSRWRPKVVAVEIHGGPAVTEIAKDPVAKLLCDSGYTFVTRLWHTSIFADVSARGRPSDGSR